MMAESHRASPGGSTDFLPMNYPSFGAAAKAVFLFLKAARQHDIGITGRFREEEINYTEELQLRQSFAGEISVRKRHQRIETEGQERFDFAAMNGFHDFCGGVTRLRKIIRSDAPDPGNVFPRRRIGKRPLARKLIALLSVLAPSLTVALPGDHGRSGAFVSEIARSQRKINDSETVFYAL